MESCESQLEAIANIRMGLTRKLSQQEEQAESLCRALREAQMDNSSSCGDTSQMNYCRAEQDALRAVSTESRVEAMELDEQMRACSAHLPTRKASIACTQEFIAGMCESRAHALEAWSVLLYDRLRCSSQLQDGHCKLHVVKSSLQVEQNQRRELRNKIGRLTQSLCALDRYLESLDTD